jgi:hypothetical protein
MPMRSFKAVAPSFVGCTKQDNKKFKSFDVRRPAAAVAKQSNDSQQTTVKDKLRNFYFYLFFQKEIRQQSA